MKNKYIEFQFHIRFSNQKSLPFFHKEKGGEGEKSSLKQWKSEKFQYFKNSPKSGGKSRTIATIVSIRGNTVSSAPKHLKTTDASRRAKVIIHLLLLGIIHLSRIFHTVVHGSWSRAAWQTRQICSPNRSSNIGRAIYPCQVDQCPVQTTIHQPLHCGHFGLSRLSKRLRFRISSAREADFHSPLLFKQKATKVSRFSFRRVRFEWIWSFAYNSSNYITYNGFV